MKEYIVINYVKNSLCYDFRKLSQDEKKYLNKNSFYKDSLFYTLNYLKKKSKVIINTIKNQNYNMEWFIIRKTVTFKYVKELIEKLEISKLRLLFPYSLGINDYNTILTIKTLKEIDCYFMPTFVIRKYNSSNIKVTTHYKETISKKFMLSQDSLDYDTLYYRKQLYITEDYNELSEDIKEFFKINYYLKSIDVYCFSKELLEKLVNLIKEDNTKNIIILMHQYSDKANFIGYNFKYLKNLNIRCRENSLCEFRIIYSRDFIKNNLFKQLSYNNLKLIFILVIYLSLSTFIIYKSFSIVETLNTQKLKYEMLPEETNKEENNEIKEEPKEELKDEDIILPAKEEEEIKKSKYDLENIMSNLTKINKETVGYLVVNNTNISYPVVQHSDNSYYLKHDFYKKKTSMGWIYLDYRNDKDTLNSNNIIYGHSMLNGTMFGTLKKVLQASYRKNSDNMIISYSTRDKDYKFKIFSAYRVDYTTDYLKTDFDTEKDFNNFVKLLKSRSVFKSKETIKYGDKILTLSTCTGSSNRRLVVHAVLIKEEE